MEEDEMLVDFNEDGNIQFDLSNNFDIWHFRQLCILF